MRFHDFRELPALIRRQFAANFTQHFPEFLADLFADFVPHGFHSFLAVADDGFDAVTLLRGQSKLGLHPARKFAHLGLTRHCRHLSNRSSSTGIRRGARLSNLDGQTASHNSGGEDHQRGENGFPGIHHVSVELSNGR